MIRKYTLPVLLLIALLTSCSPQLSPEEVIARAIDAINELQTYRFEITGTMTVDGETSHGNMQGEFVAPDRLHLIDYSDDRIHEGIRIGQTEYRRSDSDNWEVSEWSAAMSSVRTNWAAAVAEILDILIELGELRDETIDGVSCFHYRGSVDIEAQVEEQIANLDPSLPGYEEIVSSIEQQLQSEHNVEFWIGKRDYLLRRLDAHYESAYTEEHITATYSYRFFDFDEPITIEPPIID